MPNIGPLKIKVQLFCGPEIGFGPGKADLLTAIDKEGSIAAAGRALGMSYRRTWLLVDTMNRCWRSPLVEATPGGGREKGARLTAQGREVLSAYHRLEEDLGRAADGPALEALRRDLRLSPLPSHVGHPDEPGAS